MRHSHALRIGPVGFRVGSDWAAPVAALRRLYAGYPAPEDGVADFTVRLEAVRPWRRLVRPSVAIRGDFTLPEAVPMALEHGLLAAEMGMNLQMALGHRGHLLLHAAVVERDGRALLMTGESGAGKSTLAALMGERGWRLLGDEFALIDLVTGQVHPFPRLISLKNSAIGLFEDAAPDRWGPLLLGTPKGSIRHLRPCADAVARMGAPATPHAILFPRFGFAQATRPVARSETFMRLTQASTNYVALGEAGYDALATLVASVPALAIDFPDGDSGVALAEAAWG